MLKQHLNQLKIDRTKSYILYTLPLNDARRDEEFVISGSYIYVLDTDGNLSLRFNEISNDIIPLQKYRTIETPFYRLFLTNSAQTGKTIKLAIGIETDIFNIQDFGVALTQALIEESTGVLIFNITCTAANTEYSQALGECRKFLIKSRTGDLKVCFTSGQSGTTYISLSGGQGYNEDLIHPAELTLYFQSPAAGTIVEIVKWL